MADNIESRVSEIEQHVASNDLDAATRRLMDFVNDFGTDRRQRRQVIILRGLYNDLRENIRISGKTRRSDIQARELRNLILEVIDEIVTSTEAAQRSASGSQSSQSVPDSVPPEPVPTSDIPAPEAERADAADREPARAGSRRQPVACECIRVSKTFSRSSIGFTLHPISLKLKMGEITALVGENGSGKTTLLKIVAGQIQATKGSIFYPILPLRKLQDAYQVKQVVAYIPQEFPAWSGLLTDNLRFTAGLHGLRGERNEQEVEFVTHRLGLERYKAARWSEISGGFKTRFSLARVLLHQPQILVLDEPLANLDVSTQITFLQDLRDFSRSVTHPMAIIISSQHLHEVEDIADNIIFLRDGQELYNGPMGRLGEDRKENSFELACDLSKNELMDVIDRLAYQRIDPVGNHFVIHTPRSITAADLLQILLAHNIEVKLFRDISKSTRKLFSEEA